MVRLALLNEGHLPRNALVFTSLMTPEAKHEIRFQSEENLGCNFATVYAALERPAEYVKTRQDALTQTHS